MATGYPEPDELPEFRVEKPCVTLGSVVTEVRMQRRGWPVPKLGKEHRPPVLDFPVVFHFPYSLRKS